jgi:hypothetical protein
MPELLQFQGIIEITCADCQLPFQHQITRSNNNPRMCLDCRKIRTTANKRRHEERRTSTPAKPSKEIYEALCDIPDYVMHPVKFIDAAIKVCD